MLNNDSLLVPVEELVEALVPQAKQVQVRKRKTQMKSKNLERKLAKRAGQMWS
jgi:hypothetical protein